VLTLRTPMGRKVQPEFISHGAPLIRVKLKDLAAAGVTQVPRTVGMEGGRPALEDGRVLDVSNVIWCTGFRVEFPWIDLPIFGEDGRPMHERGVVVGEPGLYFVGLLFQYAVTSDVLPGVGRDAEYIAKRIASSEPNGRPTAHAMAGARRPEALDRVRTGVADAQSVLRRGLAETSGDAVGSAETISRGTVIPTYRKARPKGAREIDYAPPTSSPFTPTSRPGS